MQGMYWVLATALALAGCGSEATLNTNKAYQTTTSEEPQTRAVRVPVNPDGFLKWITGLNVAKAEPFARANEICDWFDRGYAYPQVIQAETAVIQRDWTNVLDPYGRPAVNSYEIGFLVSGSAKFVCPEHADKLSG
ncbi:Uncharacterised protein [Mycobacteroides abscessus subsp. abscessus]|nr:Uncharacterised protein [Mycobacteroides abscessus subsp. abscessus]